MPQNIMCALYAVMQPDHFKFASYGPVIAAPYCLFVLFLEVGRAFSFDKFITQNHR